MLAAVCVDECRVCDPVRGSADPQSFKRAWELHPVHERVPCLLQTINTDTQLEDAGRVIVRQTILKTPVTAHRIKAGQVVEITGSNTTDLVGTRWLVSETPATGWELIRRYTVEKWEP